MNSARARALLTPWLSTAVGTGWVLATLDVALGVLGWDKGDAFRPFVAPYGLAVVGATGAALLASAVGVAVGPLLRLGRVGGLLASQVALLVLWLALALSLFGYDWVDRSLLLGTLPFAAVFGWLAGRASADDPGRIAAGVCALALTLGVALGGLWFATRGERLALGLLAIGVGLTVAVALALRAALARPRGASAVRVLAGVVALGWVSLGTADLSVREPESVQAPRSETGPGPAGDRIQRVILVVVDTLRRDALSCYAEDATATPSVDRLARDGLVFHRARAAAPWTLPSMASLLSGLGGDVHLTTKPGQRLPEAVPTLAEALGGAGYRTAAIGENSILRAPSGLTQGFDEYDWFPRFAPEPPIGSWLAERLYGRRTKHHLLADELTDRAIDWLERHADEDTFLWLHYFDPHVPYAPPAAFMPAGPAPSAAFADGFFELQEVRLGHVVPTPAEKDWIRRLYAGEVRFLDRELGRLIDHLEERGWYDETLIVFTSDHGEEFWEHGGFEHGHAIWEEVLGVPLIVKLPGSALRKDVDVPVSIESVGPTIQELCGVAGETPWTSPPLCARASFDVTASERALVSLGMLYYEERLAILDDGTKYVLFPSLGREELYELERDAGERIDRAHERPDELGRFRALWRDRRDRAAELRGRYGIEEAETVGLDAADAAELRKLGYVR